MAKNIFINLPVKDLSASMEFFRKLGFSFNKQFTNETAASLVIGEHLYAMLLTEEKFISFTKKPIANPRVANEAIIAIDAENREAVDAMAQLAIDAGATQTRDPEDYDFMYSRSFEDLDGHHWEVFWMDPNYVQKEA